MSDLTERLRECPFCGGEAKLVSGASSTVQCQNDQCIIGDAAPFNDFSHRQDAIAAWNKRPTLETLTQENARLREALEWRRSSLDLEAVAIEARSYLADAMREPSESYPPVFATYVEQGVPSASAAVRVDTAITAIAFALMAERSGK